MNHRYVARRISKNVFIVWGKSGRCEDPVEKVGGGEKEGRGGVRNLLTSDILTSTSPIGKGR